jgi:hypothetical protein
VEFDRATGSAVNLRVRRALEHDEPLATTGIVLLELLAGAQNETRALELQQLLARCRFLPLEEPSDYEAAAALYRACRRAGATVRRVQDCLIAAVAIRTGTELLHRDTDFDVIALHTPLAVAS